MISLQLLLFFSWNSAHIIIQKPTSRVLKRVRPSLAFYDKWIKRFWSRRKSKKFLRVVDNKKKIIFAFLLSATLILAKIFTQFFLSFFLFTSFSICDWDFLYWNKCFLSGMSIFDNEFITSAFVLCKSDFMCEGYRQLSNLTVIWLLFNIIVANFFVVSVFCNVRWEMKIWGAGYQVTVGCEKYFLWLFFLVIFYLF